MSRDHCGAGCLILRPWSGSFASLRVLVTGHPPGGQDRTSDGGSRPPNDAPIGGRTGRSATGRDLQDGPAPLVDHARSGESGELTAGFGHRAATTPNPLPTRLSSRASARRAGPFGPTGVPGRPGSTLIRRAVSARGRAPLGPWTSLRPLRVDARQRSPAPLRTGAGRRIVPGPTGRPARAVDCRAGDGPAGRGPPRSRDVLPT